MNKYAPSIHAKSFTKSKIKGFTRFFLIVNLTNCENVFTPDYAEIKSQYLNRDVTF